MSENIKTFIAGGVMSVAVFFTALFLLLGSANAQAVTPEAETATQAVIADQLNAFQERDHARAFSHAAPTIKQVFKSEENFINMVKGGYGVLYNPDNYIFGRNFDVDGTIHQELIVTEQNGKQWQAVYTLKQMPDGSWKITGVKMNPYTGAAT
ncbi:MAG: DUF4864 domain-containing protein [Pseudomonadota bacterium]